MPYSFGMYTTLCLGTKFHAYTLTFGAKLDPIRFFVILLVTRHDWAVYLIYIAADPVALTAILFTQPAV